MAADETDKLSGMLKRQRTGSVVCASCGSLVGVNDDKCYSCGRRNPGLWGYGRACGSWGTISDSSRHHDLWLRGHVHRNPAVLGPSVTTWQTYGRRSRCSDRTSKRCCLWRQRHGAGGRGRALVVIPERRLVARRRAASAFNMMTLRQLGPPTAELYGPARMVIIYTSVGWRYSSAAPLQDTSVPMRAAAPHRRRVVYCRCVGADLRTARRPDVCTAVVAAAA